MIIIVIIIIIIIIIVVVIVIIIIIIIMIVIVIVIINLTIHAESEWDLLCARSGLVPSWNVLQGFQQPSGRRSEKLWRTGGRSEMCVELLWQHGCIDCSFSLAETD